MTIEEKAKAYDSALEQAKKELAVSGPYSDSTRQIFRLFPQLKENNDEKIRKWIFNLVNNMSFENLTASECAKNEEWKKKVLAYLENQKAMTAEEHEIVKVNINGIHGLFPPVGDGQYIDETAGTLQAGEKQKEPHYTKRNALLDKCVENCDPKTVEEVNKRVGDIMNIPELSPFEQALTNFIGDWENDEEHWPSQFAKKHGKRIFDIAREEVQKEQKHPNGCFTCDEYKKGYEEGRRNGVTAGYNKAMKEVEQKEQKPIRDIISGDAIESCMLRYLQSAANRNDDIEIIEDTKKYKKELLEIIEKEQKPTNKLENAFKYYTDRGIYISCGDIKAEPIEQKPISCNYITPNKEFFQWIYDRLVHVHKENPNMDYMRSFKERINNLSFEDKHHWKPSEEQMAALDKAIPVCMGVVGRDEIAPLESLYEQLKKL